MKINIPIGKILAGVTILQGVITGDQVAKAIKNNGSKGMCNAVAQNTAMSLINIPHVIAAQDLWNNKDLNLKLRIGGKRHKHKGERCDERFTRKTGKYFHLRKTYKISDMECVDKILHLWSEDCRPDNVMSRAAFCKKLNEYPVICEIINDKNPHLIWELLIGYDFDDYVHLQELINDREEPELDPRREGSPCTVCPEEWAEMKQKLAHADINPKDVCEALEDIRVAECNFLTDKNKVSAHHQFQEAVNRFNGLDFGTNIVINYADKAMNLDDMSDDEIADIGLFGCYDIINAIIAGLRYRAVDSVVASRNVQRLVRLYPFLLKYFIDGTIGECTENGNGTPVDNEPAEETKTASERLKDKVDEFLKSYDLPEDPEQPVQTTISFDALVEKMFSIIYKFNGTVPQDELMKARATMEAVINKYTDKHNLPEG